jgi:poly [ADP-ribose] polymerase
MKLQETTLIKVNAGANNNKFYRVTLHEDSSLTITWGRVGSDGVSETRGGGETAFKRIIAAKLKRGYKHIEVTSTAPAKKVTDSKRLEKVALTSLGRGSLAPALTSAISYMASCNRHNIIETSGGMLQVDESGIVKTALGLVSAGSLEAAEKVLARIAKGTTAQEQRLLTTDYLMLVPQRVKGREWDRTFFTEDTTVEDQRTLLRQLRSSLAMYDARISSAEQTDEDAFDPAQFADIFSVGMAHVEDSTIVDKIKKLFASTLNRHHTSRHMQVANVFELTYEDKVNEEFEKLSKKLGNQKLLWHGTDAGNVLSILREGLYVPPMGDPKFKTSGRMFGAGVYFADQSTKSLGYSSGYWKDNRTNRCFMFLADVVMGREYWPNKAADWRREIPSVATLKTPGGHNYNSISVRGGTCGVVNNEMIVWDTKQIRLKYLVEFTE